QIAPPAVLEAQRHGGKAVTEKDREEEREVYGVASGLVGFAPEYAKVAQLLLGRVVVTADMEAAIAVSRKMSGWSKIVTLEGELLTPGGALTGGSLQGRGAHLVGRKGEMDDLKAGLPRVRAEVETLTAQMEGHARALQAGEAERND